MGPASGKTLRTSSPRLGRGPGLAPGTKGAADPPQEGLGLGDGSCTRSAPPTCQGARHSTDAVPYQPGLAGVGRVTLCAAQSALGAAAGMAAPHAREWA